MEWITHLNDAMRYIEDHLLEDINYETLGKIACCSAYHFQRTFSYMAGIPLSEYIRRRRLSLAAIDLQNGNPKIIDVALKYGYTSPTAFNRAFQNLHGIAPSLVKDGSIALKAYLPLSFKITIKGVEEMNYRIETTDQIRIVGVAHPLEKDMEKNFEVVPKMWQKVAMDGTLDKLCTYMNSTPMGILGVNVCNDDEEWRYFIAAASDKPIDDTLEEYTIPASTWAVFSGEGNSPSAIQTLEQRVWTEWLPNSGYEYAQSASDMEVYLNADPNHSQFEVWIPIVKK
ncbi:MAG: AraC family transcriptional regulator [Eubacterium sp.]